VVPEDAADHGKAEKMSKKKSGGRLTYYAVFLVSVALVAVTVGASARQDFDVSAEAMSELQYLEFLQGQVEVLGEVMDDYSATVSSYVDTLNAAAALAELSTERQRAVDVRDRVRAESVPCSAYSTVKTLVAGIADDIVSAIDYTVKAVNTQDPYYIDLAIGEIESASRKAELAANELDSIDYPACPAQAGGGGGIDVGGAVLAVCGLLFVVLLAAGLYYNKKQKEKKEAEERERQRQSAWAQYYAKLGYAPGTVPIPPAGYPPAEPPSQSAGQKPGGDNP